MSDARDTLNATLGGRYRVERELGAGGMATVYLARDLKHDRDVAIKVLRPELGAVLGADRFLAEIKVTANLRHPNLLPLFDSGEADGLLFYVMPYIEGPTLRARLKAEPQLPVDEVTRIVGLLAGALDYAHAAGVVHRDLKPENILLQAGQPVIADFGIALAVAEAGGDRITQTGLSLGTPLYMSPEQASGERAVDARSDQYALGAIAYEMLTGEPPHTGATARVIIARLMTEGARPVRSARPGVPVGVDAAVLRALSKSPADRYSSCGALVRAMNADEHEVAVTPEATTTAAQAPTSYPRAPWIALVLGVLVIGGVGALVLRGRANGDRWATQGARRVDKASVAVLPFTDLSADRGNEYFGDGIAETLISALGRVPGLDVAARTSAFSFRGKNVDVREIGSKLGVSTVLEGSVQRAGDKLRITAQLVKASDGVSLWSETFDRSATDLFAVQDEVTRAVITALKGKVLAASTPASAASTRDSAAYDLYLQGRFHQANRTSSEVQHAIALFTKAIGRDSSFAQAWSGLADAYIVQTLYSDVPARATLDKAHEAAQRALAADPENGEALTSHAYLLMTRDWNWAASDTAFQHALRVSPGYALAHKWNADLHGIFGRMDDERREYLRAWQLDPLSSVIAANLGQHYDEFGDTVQMLAWVDRSLALDPSQPLALRTLAPVLVARGDSARFFDVHARLAAGTAMAGASVPELRSAWRRGGGHAAALAQVAAFDRLKQPFESARWSVVAGDADAVFRSLDRAYAARAGWMPFFKNYLNRPAIRRDPRYRALVKRMGMPDEVP